MNNLDQPHANPNHQNTNPEPFDQHWYELGHADWTLGEVIARNNDGTPEAETAREERDQIREHIPTLTANQLRAYLDGILENMDMHFILGG